VLNGEVQMTFINIAGVRPLIANGKLRALAVTSADRQALLPEVPTMIESGFPDFVVRHSSASWRQPHAGSDRRQAERRHQCHDGVARNADRAQRTGREGWLRHSGGLCNLHGQ
jgi:tripartite-type tricarboxylate transporter receptor subunit TctC